MKLKERAHKVWVRISANDGFFHQDYFEQCIVDEFTQLEKQLASARAIMQKFVDKVDRGMARSTETYAEMKEWLDD